MFMTKQHLVMARTLGVALVALSLGACATYDDEFAGINSRLVQLDTRVPGAAQSVDFAERHRAIVRRIGRFPHRNAILGRASTAEEEAFLREPGSSF